MRFQAFSIALVLTFAIRPGRADTGAGWPMRGGDPQNSKVSSYYGIKKGVTAWALGGGHPSVGSDGTIYVGVGSGIFDGPGDFWAVKKSGTKLWSVPLKTAAGRDVRCGSPPAIGADGTMYLGWGFAGDISILVMFAFNPDGTLRWRYEPNFSGQMNNFAFPVVGPPGQTLYMPIIAGNRALLAIDGMTGAVRWRFDLPHHNVGGQSVALGFNGHVYYACSSYNDPGALYCLDGQTGELVWEIFPMIGGSLAPAVEWDALNARDNLYALGVGGSARVGKITGDGQILWTYPVNPAGLRASPAVKDGKVYIPAGEMSSNQGMHIVNAQTGLRLALLAPGRDARATAIDRKGNIFFQADDSILAYASDGTKLWEAALFNSSSTSLAIGHDGLILGRGSSGICAYKSVLARGDMNCDGSINLFDIDPFVRAMTDQNGYAAAYPICTLDNPGDLNLDGSTNLFDIPAFVECLTQ